MIPGMGVFKVASLLGAVKIPLMMLALLAVSGLGLYVTASLKQAGAAKVETQMLRQVIEHNEEVRDAQAESIRQVRQSEAAARQRLAGLQTRLAEATERRKADAEVEESHVGNKSGPIQCPLDCYFSPPS